MGTVAGAVARLCVLVPMRAMSLVPLGIEIWVPAAVIVPPGVKVWPAMTNWEAEFAVYVEPAKVSRAGW